MSEPIVYKPRFDRYFFSLLAKRMEWENPEDALYEQGITTAQLQQLSDKLQQFEQEVHETVEWKVSNRPYVFCAMRVDELQCLFFTGEQRPELNAVKLRLLNRLARFISTQTCLRTDIGESLVSLKRFHRYNVKSYDELCRQTFRKEVYDAFVKENAQPLDRNRGSGLAPLNGQIDGQQGKPGDRLVVTYHKNGKQELILQKQSNGSWRIADGSTTHANPAVEWQFVHIAAGQRFTMQQVATGEPYSYDQILSVKWIKSAVTEETSIAGTIQQDYLINLHAGTFFIKALGAFLLERYQISLATLEDFRELAMALRETEECVQALKQKFGDILFPFEDDSFCFLNNEELRNLFGYNGMAYFNKQGYRIFYQSSEKPVKINMGKLNKLARFMSLESQYPDAESLEACCYSGARPYKDYVDLEREYAQRLLSQSSYQRHGGGSGINLAKTGILSDLVAIGTTVTFSYQRINDQQLTERNTISMYYLGDACWRITSKGDSHIDDKRVWRTAALYNGEELHLCSLEGDMNYSYGHNDGGIRIEKSSNRAREGSTFSGHINVLKIGNAMGAKLK